MKVSAVLPAAATAVALVVGLAACRASAAAPAPAASPSSAAATHRAHARPSAKPSAAARPSPSAKPPMLTAAQSAAMNNWYTGETVAHAANVCGDVNRLFLDDASVNSGTGVSSLQADITSLQDDVATALADPPPVERDARIWRRVLNAYGNAAGDPTSSGLVAAARSAKDAPWRWTPSFGGTLLTCINVNV
jgi:hypothetical protein